MKSNSERDTSWNKSSQWYTKTVGQSGHYYHTHTIMPAVKAMLQLSKTSSVADFGCGQGVLARHIPADIPYIGIDASPRLIADAKKLNKASKHSFLVSDLTKPLHLKSPVSHILIILALQNMKMLDEVIANVEQNLQSRGSLILVINHPCFRIPRQSGWMVNPENKLQVRWTAKYMSPMEIPIAMHPGISRLESTWSYHHSLEDYVTALERHHLAIIQLKELVSDKESQGKAAKMENRSRAEIPLFMVIKAVKLTDKPIS